MKYLIVYIVLIPIVLGFIVYKLIEAIINGIFNISNVKEKWHFQLNIFSLERVMITKIDNGWKKISL